MGERLRSLRTIRIPWLAAVSVVVLIFLFFPIAIILLFSFHDSPALSFPIRGLSLRWYSEVLASRSFRIALRNTLIVGSINSVVTMVMGTLGCLALTRYRFRLKGLVSTLLVIPVSLPGLFIGLSLLSLFAFLGFRLSLISVLIGHLIYTLPYFVIVANARLERFDTIVEEAARDLGATPWQTFSRVTLPMIAPSVLAAGILAFALSFDEFLITFFVIGSESTLPMLIWSMMRRSLDPRVNVISAIVLGASVILIVILSRFVKLSDISL